MAVKGAGEQWVLIRRAIQAETDACLHVLPFAFSGFLSQMPPGGLGKTLLTKVLRVSTADAMWL
jgi:hypothetical protein